ncbi:MATE family efflux transporter [uncultured Olleya sp.]|uniref:lipopolysaccharide biosynthesis protein n=1 Tax=uncultured Olleya sp. TaxID=757243 RepID=UPI002592D087|nr:MATE family efflux transporter [uncultured Olleya sp.]
MKIIGKNLINDSFFSTGIKVTLLRITGVGLQFITLFVITNAATEQLVGKYNFLNSIIIILGSVCLLGMNNSFLQFSGKLTANNNFEYLKTLYKKKLVILIISALFFFFVFILLSQVFKIGYFQDEAIKKLYFKIFILLLPYALTQFNYQVLRGLNLLFTSEVFRNIFRFGGFLLLVLTLLLTNNINKLLEAFIFIFGLLSFVSTVIVLKKFKNFENKNSTLVISYKEILKTSLPMSFSFISLQIMQGVDIFFLERYYSFETVAFYGTAVKISTVIGIILMSVNAIVAPKIATLYYQKNLIELKSIVEKSTLFTFILSTPIIIIILIFSENILCLFGENYTIAKTALFIILLGQIFNAFCGSVGVYLNMTGKQKTYQLILLIALIINIILNAILIPKYGMNGAAISTSFSLVFWNILGGVIIYRKDKMNIFVTSKLFKTKS